MLPNLYLFRLLVSYRKLALVVGKKEYYIGMHRCCENFHHFGDRWQCSENIQIFLIGIEISGGEIRSREFLYLLQYRPSSGVVVERYSIIIIIMVFYLVINWMLKQMQMGCIGRRWLEGQSLLCTPKSNQTLKRTPSAFPRDWQHCRGHFLAHSSSRSSPKNHC